MTNFDVLIKDGTILDGTGGPAAKGNVAIADGKIVEVGAFDGLAAETIDAEGLYVTPGFIDINSHSAYTLLVDPRAVSALYQGVTLELVGNCGHGCFPISDPGVSSKSIYGFNGMVPLDWHSGADYMDRLEASNPGINIATLVPNAQLRIAGVGPKNRPASSSELASMKRVLEESLEAGSWGLSVGLEYPAEAGASEDELVELCRVVHQYGGLFATHVRERDKLAVEAIEEVIRVSRQTDVRLQISHLLPRSGPKICNLCLDKVDDAHRDGIRIGFDMHTRTFGTTYLRAALPPELLQLEPDQLGPSLKKSKVRDSVRVHRSIISALNNWNNIIIFDHPSRPEYSRKSVAEIAALRSQDEISAVCDLIAQECEAGTSLMVIMPSYTEDQLCDISQHPLCAPGSNGTTMGVDGPLAGTVFHGTFTWAARYWNFMVNEREALSPEEAVHRLAGLPASYMELKDRGILSKGAHADIAIFDSKNFRERGTLYNPSQLADGMKHVIVNGVVALKNGSLTENRGGRVLRR